MLKDAASAWVADHQETVNAILTAIQNLWEFVQTIFSALMTAAGALGDWLGAWADENLGDIVQTVTAAVNSIVSFVSAFASWAAAFWQAHGQTIMSIVRPLLEAVKTIISTALQAITQIFNIFAALFRGDWGELFRGIATLVLTILNGIVSTIGNIFQSMLAAAQGKRVTLSMRYKVNAEISGNAVIVLWANYESGNESRRLMTLATTSQTTPAGDWTTETLNYTFKDEKPTRVYLFAYLYAGTGSLSVELPTMSEATGKKSTISLIKDGTTISSFALDLSKYATGTELKVGLDEISASVVKNGEIRSKFALDSSSCTISAGTIKFTGNTLVVESTNFRLNADGTVGVTGTFYSNGSKGNVTIGDGMIYLSALNADGKRYKTISLNYTNTAYPSGSLGVHSRRADGTVGDGVVIQGGDADSKIFIYNAYGNADVILTSGAGNNCGFAGGIDVRGENGVNVSRAVSARDLKWWGDLMATGAQTRIKPRGGQNALYTDWQYWKSVNGVSYWVLTGKDTPW